MKGGDLRKTLDRISRLSAVVEETSAVPASYELAVGTRVKRDSFVHVGDYVLVHPFAFNVLTMPIIDALTLNIGALRDSALRRLDDLASRLGEDGDS